METVPWIFTRVRSSYRAGRLWAQSMRSKGWALPLALAHFAEERLVPAGQLPHPADMRTPLGSSSPDSAEE